MRLKCQYSRIRLLLTNSAVLVLLLSVPLAAQCTNNASHQELGTTVGSRLTTCCVFGPLFLPRLGQTGQLFLVYSTRSTKPLPFVMVVGTGRSNLPFLGGTLRVDPNTIVATISGTLVPGIATQSLVLRIPIPNNSSLCGKVAVFQAGIIDPSSKGGIVLTNGLEWRVGK